MGGNLDIMECYIIKVIIKDRWKKSGRMVTYLDIYIGPSAISLCSDEKHRAWAQNRRAL
jgi:hypothetical protein